MYLQHLNFQIFPYELKPSQVHIIIVMVLVEIGSLSLRHVSIVLNVGMLTQKRTFIHAHACHSERKTYTLVSQT